ncbi:MAG: hypothetical protein HXY52_09335 [Nitrospirae bacterium]|jgi:hypothetical protein|nr:hypothetical protein [Nitrospirota bacterium]
MKYIEAIKTGFRTINKNWQLVLIQIGMLFISITSFFVIVGIPFGIAFLIFGIDLTEFTDITDVFRILKSPSDTFSKYIVLILILIISLILYILFAIMLGLYVLGGSIGVIGKTLKENLNHFSFKDFTYEAKSLFLKLLGFTSVVVLIFILTAFFLSIVGGSIAAIISYAKEQDSTLALFFGTFFSLILIILSMVMVIFILAITIYGFASLYFKKTGAFKSIKEAVSFLLKYPNGFWLYAVLFLGYFIILFLLGFLSYPFTLIPIIGTIISFPYQFLYYALQTYLSLVVIAIILSYYYSKEFQEQTIEVAPETPEFISDSTENNEEIKPDTI